MSGPSRSWLLGLALALALALASAPSAQAAPPTPVPAWSIQTLSAPSNFKPGDESGQDSYEVFITNNGGEVTDESPIEIVDTLPAGLTVKSVELLPPRGNVTSIAEAPEEACKTTTVAGQSTVSCKVTNAMDPPFEPAKLFPDNYLALAIRVKVPLAAAGPLLNQVAVKGGGANPASDEFENKASEEAVTPGFVDFHSELTGADGQPVTEADSFPYQYTTSFAVKLFEPPAGGTFVAAGGNLKQIEVALPPGLAGNPTAIERCPAQEFNSTHGVSSSEGNGTVNECPLGSVVGIAAVQQLEGTRSGLRAPIYNLIPPKGMPAQLGFQVLGAPIYIDTKVRTDGDYGLTAYLRNVTEANRVTASRVMIWGTPWDESHDPLRGSCVALGVSCHIAATAKPFLRAPSSCGNPLVAMMSLESWTQPPAKASESSSQSALEDCAAPDFSPTLEAKPTSAVADSPSGLDFDLHLPQRQHEDPEGLGEADLRDVSVTLPQGLVVNPASANGLGACTPAQIGLATPPGQLPIHFKSEPAQCPDAAKIGTVEAVVPALDHPLTGSVFLAAQEENPFNSLLAIYIVLEDPQTGIVVKLASKVSPDPLTGQLTATLKESPQLPVEDFKLDFFEGPRAPLRTPPLCSALPGYTTISTLTPWTAPEGQPASPSSSFAISSGPGGPCPSGALAPQLSAGLASPAAGTYSPFSLQLSRPDGSGEFAAITSVAPQGLSAKLAGVPYCPETGIAQAMARNHPRQGALELAQPSCPAASQVGTTTAGAGAGPLPFYTSGKVYLAGPYKGAPLSLVAIIPAIAGPFDLGVVVNRIALEVDPTTAQVTAKSDPLPRILSGIPLDVRDVRVDLDRSDFTLAPTSCEASSVNASVLGTSGASASVSERFQLEGCAKLGFKPKLSLKLSGGTRRNQHPALKSVITYPKGAYANVAKARVTLPASEFIDQAHIGNPCTRPVFAEEKCPKISILGTARAFSPLLEKPLEGKVYFRSNGGERELPDIVADLKGQIHLVLVGYVDAAHKKGSEESRLRTTFAQVPDAPVSKFVLQLKGGKEGLLVNSGNLCKIPNKAVVKLTAHNGRVYDTQPAVGNSCPKQG